MRSAACKQSSLCAPAWRGCAACARCRRTLRSIHTRLSRACQSRACTRPRALSRLQAGGRPAAARHAAYARCSAALEYHFLCTERDTHLQVAGAADKAGTALTSAYGVAWSAAGRDKSICSRWEQGEEAKWAPPASWRASARAPARRTRAAPCAGTAASPLPRSPPCPQGSPRAPAAG